MLAEELSGHFGVTLVPWGAVAAELTEPLSASQAGAALATGQEKQQVCNIILTTGNLQSLPSCLQADLQTTECQSYTSSGG